MPVQSEAALENGLIDTLQKMNYEYVHVEEEKNLSANFKKQLEKHNKKKLEELGRTEFTESEFEKILIYLEGGTRFEKAKKLRDLFPLELESGERLWVEFLNRTHWCQNEFQVSNQITVEGRKKCRYDVTILINGLPLVQIELKRRGVELKQAYNQIQRYHKTSFHGLFDYIQLFVISNGVNTRYFANNPNSGFKFTFNWTDAANVPFNDLEKFATVFFDKCTLGKIIGKYIVLHEGDKCLMVLRPYQFYAVEKILDRVENSNDNGYIWHTTGAGKTLTSFKAAQLVSELDDVDKVMFVVDRHDLDTQTQAEYEAFEPGAVDSTDNTDELVKRLHSNSKIIITTIQKLNAAVSKQWYSSRIEEIRHSRIVMIFDECHRSHFGDCHKNIVKFFDNTQIFGFTGTPIFVENAVDGHTTKEIFGNCLHKYLIKDAIADENVLGFLVEYYHGNEDVDNADQDRMTEIAKFILNNFNLRFPEFKGEWKKTTIGKIATIKNGPFGSVLHAEDYVDEGMPIVTTEHFKNGNLPLSKNGIPQVSEDDYCRLKGYMLETDDIVFSRVGSVDINAHVEHVQQGWLFSGRVLRVRPIKSVNSLCLHYVLSTESVKRDIRNRAVGQTMPSINTPILSNTEIYMSQSEAEQKKIANLLSLLDERITTQSKIIDKLQSLIKGIAQKIVRSNKPNVRLSECLECNSSTLQESDVL